MTSSRPASPLGATTDAGATVAQDGATSVNLENCHVGSDDNLVPNEALDDPRQRQDLTGGGGDEEGDSNETDPQEGSAQISKQEEEHPPQICNNTPPTQPASSTTAAIPSTTMIAENPATTAEETETHEEHERNRQEEQQQEPTATPSVVTTTAHLEALVLRMQQQSTSSETPHLLPVPHDPDEFRALWSQTPAAPNAATNINVSEYTDRVSILYTRQQLSGNWKRRLSNCVLFWGGRTYYRIDRYHTQTDDANDANANTTTRRTRERWYPRACRYYHCPTEYISFCLRVDVLLRRTNAEWHRLHVLHHLVILVALVLLGFAVSFWVAMPSHFQWDVASVFCLLLAVLLMGGRSVCFAPAHRRVVRDMSLTVQRCCRTATRRSRHISYDLQWRPKTTSGVCGSLGIIHYDPYEWFVEIQPKEEQLWNNGGGGGGSSGERAVPPPPQPPTAAVSASQPQPPPPQDERPADEEEPRPIELNTARPNTTRWGDYEYGPNEV